jgi:2-oxoglutarate ferredoxin oxidoreductase subunit beta
LLPLTRGVSLAEKKLSCARATFIARTRTTQVNHMIQMIGRAMDHEGFSVIECLSDYLEFYTGVFDPGNPSNGGSFELIQENKWDKMRQDVTDELAAYKRAQLPFPSVFGVCYPRGNN